MLDRYIEKIFKGNELSAYNASQPVCDANMLWTDIAMNCFLHIFTELIIIWCCISSLNIQ